jgi:predicted phage-related endonuclease
MTKATHSLDRRKFVGGSDARIIMGKDEKALLRLWHEKRGEAAALDLSGVLIVQLGLVTEDLNRRWYELNSGHRISDIQRHAIHRTIPWMAATLDGLVKETGAVFEAKFMLPWSFSEEGAAEKHMAQLQHNMLVAGTKKSVLSIINGGGKWIELSIEADPIYQTILIAAEKAFWRAVKTGETPALSIASLRSRGSKRSGWSIRTPPTLGLSLRGCFVTPKALTPITKGPRAN